MIRAARADGGRHVAICECDTCGASDEFQALHRRTTGAAGTAAAIAASEVKNRGLVIQKATAKGWEYLKGHIYCPKCKAERRAKVKPAVAATVSPIRTPTRDQKREIMSLLTDAYDQDAGRYRGKDTDITLAEAIGGGCMPGWVAEIREEFFGPDGGNDEIEAVLSELTAWKADMQKSADAMHKTLADATASLRAFNEGRGRADEFLKRIESIKHAVGPKAARA